MDSTSRRRFVHLAAAGVGLSVLPAWAQEKAQKKQDEELFEVTPTEDLMREHGLLNRVLLIYEECDRRLASNEEFDPKLLTTAAGIIADFIESYHEKLEEDHLFPRFRKAGKLVDLVTTLQAQHVAGRYLTGRIRNSGTAKVRPAPTFPARPDPEQVRVVRSAIREFIRMYRPHEAREDTILFPTLHTIISKNEYDALGEDFEKKEHEMFGAEGFEGMVEKVGGIEKQLGIYDLAKFTPQIPGVSTPR
jgi:hemerythrin-like domain-containing protein